MGKKHFLFLSTAETGNRTPKSGVKGSGANHYPRAPAHIGLQHCRTGVRDSSVCMPSGHMMSRCQATDLMLVHRQFEQFVETRLLSTSSSSVWDTVKKMKLKTFSNWMEKTRLRIGEKVIKLREERQLLGRFLTIQASRPELVPKLEETIGRFEMSVIPRSLCNFDGTLYIPTDKASLMHAIEGAEDVSVDRSTLLERETASHPPRVLIIDAMAVINSMKKL